MNDNYGFDSAIGVLRYLGYTIQDGKGRMFRSIQRAAAEMGDNPPGGIMAGTICGKKMEEVTQAICDEMFPKGTRVSYHAPHDWTEKFRGTCTEFTQKQNAEVCRIVQLDGDKETHPCCVDLLEVLDDETTE